MVHAGNAALQDELRLGAGPWAPEVAAAAPPPEGPGTWFAERLDAPPCADAWAAPLDDVAQDGAGDPGSMTAAVTGAPGAAPAPSAPAFGAWPSWSRGAESCEVAAPPASPARGPVQKVERADPRTVARPADPLAKVDDPTKLAKQSTRLKQDLYEAPAGTTSGVGQVSTAIGHDRAELRVREAVGEGGSGHAGEGIFRASATGFEVGYGRVVERPDDTTSSSEVTVGTGGVGWAGSHERKGPDGNTQSVGGSFSAGQDGIKGGMKLGFSSQGQTGAVHSKVAGSVSGDTSVKVTAKVVGKHPSGVWLVQYSVPVSSEVAAELAAKLSAVDHLAPGGPAKVGSPVSIGGSVGRSLQVTVSGMRAFDSEAEAKAWQKSPSYADLLDIPVTAAAVGALRVGERRRLEGAIGASASVSASGSTLGASAGVAGSASAGIEVIRKDERWTEVIVDLHGSASASASLGAPLLTVGGQADAGALRRVAWTLDLATEDGKAAFAALRVGGVPSPSAGVLGPVEVDATSSGTSASATLPIGTIASGARQTTTTVTRPDGSRTITDEGAQVQSFTPARWLGDALPSYEGKRGLAVETDEAASGEVQDQRVGGVAEVGSDMERVWEELAMFDGRGGHRSPGAPEGGTWRLDLSWGEGSLAALAEAVANDDEAMVRAAPAAYRTFHAAMSKAGGDTVAQRAALKAYGDTGLPARANLQRLLSGREMESFISRDGCEVWIGAAGWRAVRVEFAKARERSSTNVDGALSLLSDMRVEQLLRLDQLTDWGRFKEIPPAVRSEEIDRTRSFLKEVDALSAELERREAVPGDAPSVDAQGAPPSPEPAPDDRPPELAQARAAEREATIARDAADRSYARVRRIEELHLIGVENNPASRWWRLAKDAWFGFVVDGPEAESYREAEASKVSGEEDRREGVVAQREGERQLRQSSGSPAVQELTRARGRYTAADLKFKKSASILKDVEERERAAASSPPARS